MAQYIRSDLDFILAQIKIAEAHASGTPLTSLIAAPTLPFGLRTVDGTYNNLLPGQSNYGAAGQEFPATVDPVYRPGYEPSNVPGSVVVDPQPRIISNLIVDMTSNNPAATQAYEDHIEFGATFEPVLDSNGDPVMGNNGEPLVLYHIPNVAPDEGLSAPFNSWMTLFGQFFDHGLDLINKGGSGTVFVPLLPDDPLYDADGADDIPNSGDETNFMLLTRATVDAGTDGIMGTDDDIRPINTTTPVVDQNQTYTSHSSHQVFLRAYEFNAAGDPVATGKLIEGSAGGMATWADVKEQALTLFGIILDDMDALNVPMVAADAYGNFIPGANGFPQLVRASDNELIEGNPAAPIDASMAVRTGHAFLVDIAHEAAPTNAQTGAPLAADSDSVLGLSEPGTYDDELLDAHFMAGDGRANENIALTAVHHVFHSEHNRLVDHTKEVILADATAMLAAGATEAQAIAFLNEWLVTPVTSVPDTVGEVDALVWNGERLFQAARFGTEMQYQHLVFEDFARKMQPQIDVFVAPVGYDVTIDPAIVSEFANTVYRFGHSMLTESIDRLDPNFNAADMALVDAFLNPIAFDNGGTIQADVAAGAVVRGMTRQVGNEIDEFVTDALRNNLLGLPLDLATINLARGRDTGVPSLNATRREFYTMTGDSQLTPYTSWFDFAMNLKNQTSIINFIAAYGTHETITGALTLADKRAAATLIVLGGTGAPDDRQDFLDSTGDWASGPNGVTITGLDDVDLWIGGLAEAIMPFGGMLGSTFNFVFETQLENLQNGDRFYYLARTAGMNFINELEQNSFASLIMQNTNTTHLPLDVFSTPTYILEVDRVARQFNEGLGNADPTDPGSPLVPLVIRNNPATPGADTNYLRFTGGDHVVLGGTNNADILTASIGDDTIWGDGGNDRIEGGAGNDNIDGGAGDDIISDSGGDDVIKGGDGNDVIHGGNGLNLIIGGAGSDFIITGEDASEVFAGTGNDFILGSTVNEGMQGNEGDDWIEIGTQDGAPGDNFDPFGRDNITGNDVFLGNGGFDEFVGEGGDDIMVGSPGPNRNEGMSGFDWATYKDLPTVYADLLLPAFDEDPNIPFPDTAIDRYENVEGVSGGAGNDRLFGTNVTAAEMPLEGARGSVLTNIALINGLQELLGAGVTSFDGGNIMLGGDGSDQITGRGGDDIIDGDKWLNVRISVRDINNPALEIATFSNLTQIQAAMMAGTYKPQQLQIVREILTANGAGDIDTAIFSGALANYTVEFGPNDMVTVTDNVGTDGTDTLYNIERLQFADQVVINNDAPIGQPSISDTSPTEGQLLTATRGTVDDPDGTASSVFTFRWQALIVGVWTDIVGATAASFTPTQAQVGQQIRVVTSFVDDGGNPEQVASEPTTIVGDLATGTGAANVFNGGDGDDHFIGLGGADTLNGNGGSDILDGGAGADVLNGGAGNDTLLGGAAADTMNGGAGADAMSGGAANDTYVVDDVGDAITELLGEGTDLVQTSLNAYTLGANVDNVTFNGVGDFTGTGNTLNNRIQGNGGNDVIDGGVGVDTMVGGGGNDTYYVDNAADVITEAAGGGIDTEFASVTDTLQGNVDHLTLTGTGNIGGTGNGLANTITGNSGNNALSGAGGDDLLIGGLGTDTLNGGAGLDTLEGGDGVDTLNGDGGNDILDGGFGNDIMNGGGGNDTFRFNDAFGDDTISGFDANPAGGGQDRLDIAALGITAITFASGVAIVQQGANTLVTIGDDTITLNGVNVAAVTEADFILA
ncbi:peroxidase family protein [Devosia sp.]|uniref:peroxidase family protein n=1 Tax=Devosia sp. TaxID=1871048 RepID=UPI0025E5685D|nr:peroxidase family protein [Devosia sp.]MCR6636864.1 hypothetical protein [Devosia sp.]